MDLTEFVVKYKRIITIAGINVLGILLLILLVSFLKSSAAGDLPSPQAPPSQIVKSLADDGWKLQPRQARLEYVNGLIEVYAASPTRCEQFVEEINKLPDWKVAQVQDNIVEVAKDQIVQDALEFSRLQTPQEKENFINSKIQHMSNLKRMLRGQSSGGNAPGRIAQGQGRPGSAGPDIAKSKLAKDVPVEPTKIYNKVLEKSSPAERAKVDNYISTVEGQMQRLKKAGMMK